jgi:hypothetical protein
MLTYHQVKEQFKANEFSSVQEVFTKAKTLFQSPAYYKIDPSRLYISVRRTVTQLLKSKAAVTYDRDLIINQIHGDTATGYPYFKKKRDMLHLVDKVIDEVKNNRVPEEYFTRPAIVYTVTQPGKEGKLKKRLVYCPPMEITILEIMFGLTFAQSYLGNHDHPVFSGNSQLDLFNLNINHKSKEKVSLDYSSFDQTLHPFFLGLAFEFIVVHSTYSDSEKTIFRKIIDYVMFCHVYHPITGTIKRERGIISGSFYTNLCDSISNLFILNYAYSSLKKAPDIYVGGDDAVIFTDTKIDFQQVQRTTTQLGMEAGITPNSAHRSGTAKMFFLGSL